MPGNNSEFKITPRFTYVSCSKQIKLNPLKGGIGGDGRKGGMGEMVEWGRWEKEKDWGRSEGLREIGERKDWGRW